MRQLAARQDRAITMAAEFIHPLDAMGRAQANPAATAAYVFNFLRTTDRYLKPVPPRTLGDKVVDVKQPGRIPEQSANAIEVLQLAWSITQGDRARTYLDAAKARAREAVDLLLPGYSLLPRSIDRGSELLDGCPFPDSYSSYLGGDDLMWSLWRLSRVTGSDSVG